LVKKPSRARITCVDFTDLDKACPKDSYSLPKIDILVDSIADHKLLSFMDAFLGYHQILLSKEAQEKMTFIANVGLYCYT